MKKPKKNKKMNVYFSPHFDDVVLSCGGLLLKDKSEKVVFTVFSGEYKGHTLWDNACKISSENPVFLRKEEDRRALKEAGALPVYGNFFDNAFYSDICKTERPENEYGKIKEEITRFILKNNIEKLFFPLGIDHPDHRIIGRIGREITFAGKTIFYEDFPYAINHETIKEFSFPFFLEEIDIQKKVNLVSFYASQKEALSEVLLQGRDLADAILKYHFFPEKGAYYERYFTKNN